MSLEKRIEKVEEELKPEEQGRDILITALTEQHVRVGDELVPIKREPSGYSQVEWSQPDKHGARIGIRRALYDGDQPGNWDQGENQIGN